MAKGYDAHRERVETVAAFGKILGKRAGFACEWCGGKQELRPWDVRPEREPEPENLAFLCGRCREIAGGKKADPDERHALRNALWSDVPGVVVAAGRALLRSGDPAARDAIDESVYDEELRREIGS